MTIPVHWSYSMTLNSTKLLGFVPVCLCLKSIGNMLFHIFSVNVKDLMWSATVEWRTDRAAMVFGSKTLTLSDWTSQVSASRLTLQIFLAHGLPLHLLVSLYVSVVHSTCDAIYPPLAFEFIWIWFDWIWIVTSNLCVLSFLFHSLPHVAPTIWGMAGYTT